MISASVNDLVNEWSREVVFGTCQIQVAKIIKTQMVPYFLFMGTGLETQVVYAMG